MRQEAPVAVVDVVEEDMRRLELGIRQLKIQYDMYFAGAMKRPPFLLQSSVKKIIRRYTDEALPKYHQRFLYNSLVARYNIMSELWGKRVRQVEEGSRQEAQHPHPRPHHGERKGKDRKEPGERVVARCLVGNPAHEPGSVRELYRSYVEAQRTTGSSSEIDYERFAKGVSANAMRLREKHGCERVELRVAIEDGQVWLRARPIRPTAAPEGGSEAV